MILPYKLPTNEVFDLLGTGNDSMQYICQKYGNFTTPIPDLLVKYRNATSDIQRKIAEQEIYSQAHCFIQMAGDYNPISDLCWMIGWESLTDEVVQRLINYAQNEMH